MKIVKFLGDWGECYDMKRYNSKLKSNFELYPLAGLIQRADC